jgi:hypothetical protein
MFLGKWMVFWAANNGCPLHGIEQAEVEQSSASGGGRFKVQVQRIVIQAKSRLAPALLPITCSTCKLTINFPQVRAIQRKIEHRSSRVQARKKED